MKRQQVAQFWKDIERELQQGKTAALKAGVTVLYQGTLDELARGSPGKGRRYKRGRRRYHTASVRGDAPARDTGTLQRAISFKLEKDFGVVGVKRTAPYAKYLDPPRGQKEPDIGRRPFLSSAFTKHEKRIRQVMTDELERHLRRVVR